MESAIFTCSAILPADFCRTCPEIGRQNIGREKPAEKYWRMSADKNRSCALALRHSNYQVSQPPHIAKLLGYISAKIIIIGT